MTTFVSATGPGAQPQILRNTTQKKDVEIQNAGAWASLQEAPEGGDAPAGADGAAGAADEAAPMEDDDNLWDEFKGREAQEQQAEAQKKALEEAEKKRQQEEAEAAAKAEQEAAAAEERRKIEEEEAAKKAEEEERAREAAELKNLTTKGAEDVAVEAMRQAGHGADITELGLVARQDEEDDEDDLEI
jgi:flagellar biosynthesis GTPase FlhF